MIKSFNTEFARFLVAGTTQTVASYLLYLGLLLFTSYSIAYTVSFVVGVFLAYVLQTYYAFRVPWSWRSFFQFPSVYLLQYVTGMALMWFLVEQMGMDSRIAPWLIVAIQVPFTFLLSRRIVGK